MLDRSTVPLPLTRGCIFHIISKLNFSESNNFKFAVFFLQKRKLFLLWNWLSLSTYLFWIEIKIIFSYYLRQIKFQILFKNLFQFKIFSNFRIKNSPNTKLSSVILNVSFLLSIIKSNHLFRLYWFMQTGTQLPKNWYKPILLQ